MSSNSTSPAGILSSTILFEPNITRRTFDENELGSMGVYSAFVGISTTSSASRLLATLLVMVAVGAVVAESVVVVAAAAVSMVAFTSR